MKHLKFKLTLLGLLLFYFIENLIISIKAMLNVYGKEVMISTPLTYFRLYFRVAFLKDIIPGIIKVLIIYFVGIFILKRINIKEFLKHPIKSFKKRYLKFKLVLLVLFLIAFIRDIYLSIKITLDVVGWGGIVYDPIHQIKSYLQVFSWPVISKALDYIIVLVIIYYIGIFIWKRIKIKD